LRFHLNFLETPSDFFDATVEFPTASHAPPKMTSPNESKWKKM